MNAGKVFEQDWKKSYEKTPYYFLRLIDTAKWVQGQGSTFTPSNNFDCIQYTRPYLWLLELKSTAGASISFTPYVENFSAPWDKPTNDNTKVMIKHTQVKALIKEQNTNGVIPGFILNFRERNLKTKSVPNQVYFVHIKDFVDFAIKSGKSSISEDDCKKIGIEIKGSKKKVHYSYDIMGFVEYTTWHYKQLGYLT